MKLTIDLIMSWGPCSTWTREKMQTIAGRRKYLTPLQFARIKGVSVGDKLWVLLREEIIPERELRLIVCLAVERVLPIWDRVFPDDKRPLRCIEVSRRFADGKATEEELKQARAGAAGAARAAWAAGAVEAAEAAEAAGAAGAVEAAEAAGAAGAAGAAEREAQLRDAIEVLRTLRRRT